MRASKAAKNLKSKIQNLKSSEVHISGAEGLYEALDVQNAVKRYIERALTHPKGKADKIVITIEDIKQKPELVSALPVGTINCLSPNGARKIIIKLLQSLGISKKAVDIAFEIIKDGKMRGAAIITREKGRRLEPDRERGVRVSYIGIGKRASKLLSLRLSRHGINTGTVKEALTLASKVVSYRDVIAELCVSDDPYYTTGYVASEKFGYVRIPNIKNRGNNSGGRVFFVEEGINMEDLTQYLERVPVLIGDAALCRGTLSIDEILHSPYK